MTPIIIALWERGETIERVCTKNMHAPADALPVRAEGGGPRAAFVPAQDRDLLAGGGVPDPRGLVVGRRDDALPVGVGLS
jgi:hypothetical protein